MKHPSEISQDQAQLLMSQLLDGELAASDATLLDDYLQQHPEQLDWMENMELVRNSQTAPAIATDRAASISSIQKAIATEEATSSGRSKLLSFSSFLRPLAAAAAIAIVGAVTWLELRPQATLRYEPNTVEFVATDIPGASTYIFPDEETGWTVVWVDTDTVAPDSTQG